MNAWRTLDGRAPRIIAHRGASGLLPEHTLPAYRLALEQGADVIEPDLVASSDGVLFARHDLGLRRSTDIAARPALDSEAREREGEHDWWIDELTAAQVDGLRAVQPWPRRDHDHDGLYHVPRLTAILAWIERAAWSRGSMIPLHVELKAPQYFRARGTDVAAILAGMLEAHGLTGPRSPVWLQCLDAQTLRALHGRCGNRCYLLLEQHQAQDLDASQLAEIAVWAKGIAPDKMALWQARGQPSGLIDAAHSAGLEVHAWTFRDDSDPSPFATPGEELDAAFALGVDALFCDFPATALARRTVFQGSVMPR